MFEGSPTSATYHGFQFPEKQQLKCEVLQSCTAKPRQENKNLPSSSPVYFPAFLDVSLLFGDPACLIEIQFNSFHRLMQFPALHRRLRNNAQMKA